jgi:hypothetical protein
MNALHAFVMAVLIGAAFGVLDVIATWWERRH